MTQYFVRQSGSDAAAGTSAGAAWATIGKALGASGIASGDTVYIGAGVYREAVTVSVAPTAETSVIGDTDGAKTGDAGMVIWTAADTSAGDRDFLNGSSPTINLNSKNLLTFQNLWLEGSSNGVLSNFTGHDITFRDCALWDFSGGHCIRVQSVAGVASNWLIERCYIFTSSAGCDITLARHSADYDANITIRNCLFDGLQSTAGVSISSSGAGVGFGGGVDVLSCTFKNISGSAVKAQDANLATSVPSTVYYCFARSSTTVLSANTSGQIVEDYNTIWAATARSNVTAGAHSRTLGSGRAPLAPRWATGMEAAWGLQPRPAHSPLLRSPMLGCIPASASPTPPAVDRFNRPRGAGAYRIEASGTATSATTTTLTLTGSTWGVNTFKGYSLRITGGTGSGQTKLIASNTATVITVNGNFSTTPDNTSTFVVESNGLPCSSGKASAGAASTLTDSTATWPTNFWAGYTISILSGTGSGQTRVVASNTGTVITTTVAWGTNPDNTSVFELYFGASNTDPLYAVGCDEFHDSATRETSVTDAGSVGLRLVGPGEQDIRIPVTATSTTISVKVRYDANHGTGSKPQAILLASGEIGVTTETKTATGAAGAFETLTFSAFTPTASGVVVVRLVSRSASTYGLCYFDTLAVA